MKVPSGNHVGKARVVVTLKEICQLVAYKSLQTFHHGAGETNGSIIGNNVFVAFLKDCGDIGRSSIIRGVTRIH